MSLTSGYRSAIYTLRECDKGGPQILLPTFSMKTKRWPYWIFPILHFTIVAAAAWATYRANLANGETGDDYSKWISTAQDTRDVMQFSIWFCPILLVGFFVFGKETRASLLWVILAISVVVGASRPAFRMFVRLWGSDTQSISENVGAVLAARANGVCPGRKFSTAGL